MRIFGGVFLAIAESILMWLPGFKPPDSLSPQRAEMSLSGGLNVNTPSVLSHNDLPVLRSVSPSPCKAPAPKEQPRKSDSPLFIQERGKPIGNSSASGIPINKINSSILHQHLMPVRSRHEGPIIVTAAFKQRCSQFEMWWAHRREYSEKRLSVSKAKLTFMSIQRNVLNPARRLVRYLRSRSARRKSGKGIISFSQTGEDLIIRSLLETEYGVTSPRYLDIGAYDAKHLSNSYFFYRRGCSGVLVEPNPQKCAAIARARNRDTVLNIGIGPTEQSADFFLFDSPMLDTFSREACERYVSGGRRLLDTVEVPLRTLD